MTAKDRQPATAHWRWERAALAAILLLAAGLRLWHLGQNGYGNSYYAAAVRSMLTNGRNFFFVSFDPAGFVSVDKPPVAFWIQAISAKLFGYHGISLILPEALAGTASVGLVYALVRRRFGMAAGLISGLVLASTPISVAIDRSNNPDSILVFFLLLAGYALLRASETGALRPLLACAVLMGIAFNTKTLAAFVVLPTFTLIYLLSASVEMRTRLLRLTVAAGLLIAVSLVWAVAVDLTPAAQRPYVGSSQHNSELELALGYNGMGRLSGNETGMPGGGGPGGMGPGGPPPFGGGPGGMARMSFPGGPFPGGPFGSRPGGMGPGRGFRPPGFSGTPGLLRLANPEMAGQITWLLPLAGIGLAAACLRGRRRLPLAPRAQQLLLWAGWFVTYGAIYSMARGIIHPYYLVTLAPPLAALIGIGVVALWEECRSNAWRTWLAPIALLLTAGWEARVLSGYPQWSRVLLPLLLGGTLLAALALILASAMTIRSRQMRFSQGGLLLGVACLLLCPGGWALTPVLAAGNNALPEASPDLLARRGGSPMPMDQEGGQDTKDLVNYLHANDHGERLMLLTGDIHTAASIIIQSGSPVSAIGGFLGSDPILTPGRLAQMTNSGQARYFLISPMDARRPGSNARVVDWVRRYGKRVQTSAWRPSTDQDPAQSRPADPMASMLPGGPGGFPGGPPGMGRGMGMMELYDCRSGSPGRQLSRSMATPMP